MPSVKLIPKYWIGLAAIFGCALLLRWPIANIPLERDEGEYAYIGQRILAGEIPYKNSFDQKPPGAFFLFAFIEHWIGTSPAAIHWATQLYSLGTLALVFLLGWKLFSPIAGLIAAALLALMAADASVLGNASNTETFMILPVTASLYAALTSAEKESALWAAAAGFFLGVGCLFKQVAIVHGVFLFLYLGIPWSKRWPLGMAALVGLTAVLGAAAVYFQSAGALNEFYNCVLAYNARYASFLPLAHYPARFWHSFLPQLQSFWPVYALATFGLWRGASFRILAGWLVLSFAGIVVGGYFRQHYFIQWLPAIALLSGGQLVSWMSNVSVKRRPLLIVLSLALVIGLGVRNKLWYYKPGPPNDKARILYDLDPVCESLDVGRFIAEHSGPDDRFFILGSEPQIYYYAARPSASRYIFLYPLTTTFPGTLDRQKQLSAELRATPPTYIVTVFINRSLNRLPGTPTFLFDDMHAFISSSYQIEGLLPIQSPRNARFLTGAAAQKAWHDAPSWYAEPPAWSLALWRRRT